MIYVQGYYPISVRCQHDPDTRYIESTYTEISGGSVRCTCNVIGLTSAGTHGVFLDPPTGHCSLIITRCPTSLSIFR